MFSKERYSLPRRRIAGYLACLVILFSAAAGQGSVPARSQSMGLKPLVSQSLWSKRVGLAYPANWKTTSDAQTTALISWIIPYGAADGTPDSANGAVGVRLNPTGYSIHEETLKELAKVDRSATVIADVTSGSVWRTLVWTSYQDKTPYLIVDAYGFRADMIAHCRVAFPLMASTQGLSEVVQETNALLGTLSFDGIAHENGILELGGGILRFRASGYDRIDPSGESQLGMITDPTKLDPVRDWVLRRYIDKPSQPEAR